MLIVTELFNIAVNDYVAKKSARYSRVLVVTELVTSGTQSTSVSVWVLELLSVSVDLQSH